MNQHNSFIIACFYDFISTTADNVYKSKYILLQAKYTRLWMDLSAHFQRYSYIIIV